MLAPFSTGLSLKACFCLCLLCGENRFSHRVQIPLENLDHTERCDLSAINDIKDFGYKDNFLNLFMHELPRILGKDAF